MLGRNSATFRDAVAQLRELWARVGGIPSVAAQRRLWAAQLPHRQGHGVESDALWSQHAYLVAVARCTAAALLRDPLDMGPFDWLDDGVMRGVQDQVDRFTLAEAQGDILQALYESLIDRDDRHGLGEYYTPDWLAAKVVRHAVEHPLEQRVLDPACGSGTFLFQAVRRVLAAASHLPPRQRVEIACARVAGRDIHPVAAIIARATYLLALAPVLDSWQGPLTIPVTLGDALEPEPAGAPADVLVGNPPWVAFRHMNAVQRSRARALAQAGGVYVGSGFATQNDLCALVTVRAAALHLRAGGRLAFVLPMAVLSRGQFAPLRLGAFPALSIAWDEVWTLDESVTPLFPVPSCVLFGRRDAAAPGLPETVTAFAGTLPCRDADEAAADACLTVTERPMPTAARFSGGSPYRREFRQGATLVPRMLCLVECPPDAAAAAVVSRRSSLEKAPWKTLPAVMGRVEAEFLRPVLLGESILPYRRFRDFAAVVPVADDRAVLDAATAGRRGHGGLQGWMGRAEALWAAHSDSAAMTLVGRWNYHNELSVQFPIAPLRVLYAKGGTQPAACLLRDERAVIDHMLYWMAPASEDEGHYLITVLNSETARARAAQFQARGQFGARHFDKVMFNLPIPRFAADNPLHRNLVEAAVQAELIAVQVALPENAKFQRARALVRAALDEAGLAAEIDGLVAKLLDEGN